MLNFQLSELLVACGQFGAVSRDLYTKVIPLLLSDEYCKREEDLIRCLLGLAMVNIYPHPMYQRLFTLMSDLGEHYKCYYWSGLLTYWNFPMMLICYSVKF